MIDFDCLGEYLHALQSESSFLSTPDKAFGIAVRKLVNNTRPLVGGFYGKEAEEVREIERRKSMRDTAVGARRIKYQPYSLQQFRKSKISSDDPCGGNNGSN